MFRRRLNIWNGLHVTHRLHFLNHNVSINRSLLMEHRETQKLHFRIDQSTEWVIGQIGVAPQIGWICWFVSRLIWTIRHSKWIMASLSLRNFISSSFSGTGKLLFRSVICSAWLTRYECVGLTCLECVSGMKTGFRHAYVIFPHLITFRRCGVSNFGWQHLALTQSRHRH